MKAPGSTKHAQDIELTPIADPADWEVDDTALNVNARLGAVVSVTFDAAEIARLRQAARARGLSQSRFVREAIEQAIDEAITVGR